MEQGQVLYALNLHVGDIARTNRSIGKARIVKSNAILGLIRMEVCILRSLYLLEVARVDGVVDDGQNIILPSAVVDHVQSVTVTYTKPFLENPLGIRDSPVHGCAKAFLHFD